MEPTRFRLHWKHRETLHKLRTAGKHPARVMRRVQALLLMDQGHNRSEVQKLTGVSVSTLGRLKRHYRSLGLSAIEEGSRSGRPPKLSEFERKGLIALACSEPPQGRSGWTWRLLAEEFKAREPLSYGTVRSVLKAEGVQPWREKNVVRSGSG